jgi:hypothetical protein
VNLDICSVVTRSGDDMVNGLSYNVSISRDDLTTLSSANMVPNRILPARLVRDDRSQTLRFVGYIGALNALAWCVVAIGYYWIA